MDRKDFIKKMTSTVLLSIPVLSILACSDSSDDGPPPGGSNPQNDCLKNGTKSEIGSNHGHTLQVSKADVENGNAKEYSIAGSSGHNHNVTISSDNFTMLKNNQAIQVNSSNDDGHSHSINVTCA